MDGENEKKKFVQKIRFQKEFKIRSVTNNG
jgi:hypothetical protein